MRAAEPLAETIGSTIRIVPPSSASSAAPAFDLSGRTPEQDFYERNGYRCVVRKLGAGVLGGERRRKR